jgi:hypothetical protein
VIVTEPSDAVKVGMVIQNEGGRLALSRKSPTSDLWLVGSLVD